MDRSPTSKFGPSPVKRPIGEVIVGRSDKKVAIHVLGNLPIEAAAGWMPSIKVAHSPTSLSDVEALGGESFNQLLAKGAQLHGSFLRDPDGELSFLLEA